MLRLTGFLRARLGRRIALLFFACAIVPITLFSALTLHHVRGQLAEQSHERLRLLAKESGQALLARLHLAAMEARRPGGGDAAEGRPRVSTAATPPVDVAPPGDVRIDGAPVPPLLDSAARAHLSRGEAVVRVERGRVLMAVMPDVAAPEILWVALADDYVRGWRTPWDPGTLRSPLPAGVQLCIIAGAELLGDCPDGLRSARLDATEGDLAPLDDGRALRWSDDGGSYFGWRGRLFLRRAFQAPDWELILSEPEDMALAAAHGFERMFLLAAALSLLLVPFLSQVQIRRNLEPLARLEQGTRRVADRDFDSRVEITSGDEFEQLAASFNAMADRLGRQFGALATASEIDRAILGELETRALFDTVLERGPGTLSGARVAVLSLENPAGPVVWEHRRGARVECSVELGAAAREPDGMPRGVSPAPPSVVEALGEEATWTLVPVRIEDRVPAALLVGSRGPLEEEDEEHARGLADRLAVALANAGLVDELDRLNLETITAFARAIDAKSAWTAGHSERVMAMALRLSEELEIGEDVRETLRRGTLLHDIGKIGVPGAILDKPGALSDEEFEIMRSHTTIGADIIAPVSRLRSLVPIVRHHHERWDGAGYPDGLTGSEIPFLARITAVADVFDALSSARPYRDAMPFERVREIIVSDSGSAFDPAVVAAFERLTERGPGANVRARDVA